jgi:hypothetical protein
MDLRESTGGVAVLVAVALSALPAAGASAATAPRWKVGGSFLAAGGTKTLQGSSGTVDEQGGGVQITYTGCTVNGAVVGSGTGTPGDHEATQRSCTGAKVLGSEATCSVNSPSEPAGKVVTNKLKGSLVYLAKGSSASVGLVFAPASGTELLTLEVTGGKCELAGKYPETGEVVAKFLTPGETEVEEGELEFPEAPITSYFASKEATTATSVNGLKLKEKEAKVSTKFKVRLNPKEKFGVFPG